MRSFLCGISAANQYVLTAIATKTYYNIEMWLSLSGATLFYGAISAIGYFDSNVRLLEFETYLLVKFFFFSFVVMYFILPETEQRSLEDIERHYSDNTKGITDIYIHKKCTNEQ